MTDRIPELFTQRVVHHTSEYKGLGEAFIGKRYSNQSVSHRRDAGRKDRDADTRPNKTERAANIGYL